MRSQVAVRRRRVSLTSLLIVFTTAASATVPLDGHLVAEEGCPLYLSFRKGTNPDGARLLPGRVYPLLGKNKEEATHYRILVQDASPPQRWVAAECGRVASAHGADGAPSPGEGVAGGRDGGRERASADTPSPPGRFVLAAGWLPAFCELRSRRPECRDGPFPADRPDGPGFSLHGLWPQPAGRAYCGVPEGRRDLAERGRWSRLPVLDMRDITRRRLEEVMPGALSYLHRYQWTKHGTCYGTGADTYYRHAIALMGQLNGSAVRELFIRSLGRDLSTRDLRRAFDRSFGRGAGDRVRVRCSDGMISELHIGLRGRVSESASLGQLIRAAGRRSAGCRGGRVDQPGLAD